MSKIFMITILLLSSPLLWAQQGGGQAGSNTGDRSGVSGRPEPIASAGATTRYRTISVGGRLQPRNRIVHQITTGGYVKTVQVREGQTVQAGQELFTIERKDNVLDLYVPAPVTSRINGLISEVLIQTEDDVNPGQPAVVVIGTEGYRLEASVSDKDAFKIQIGRQITARGFTGAAIGGILVSRSQEPDYTTGLFLLTFEFPADPHTDVGEFVMIELPVDRANGFFAPREAVVRRYGKYFIWIVKEDRTLEAREVELGSVYGDSVQILQGLDQGDRYLIRLTGRERDGAPLQTPGS